MDEQKSHRKMRAARNGRFWSQNLRMGDVWARVGKLGHTTEN